MTRYEQGFMNKCAEYGLPPSESYCLMSKTAGNIPNGVLEKLYMLSAHGLGGHQYGGMLKDLTPFLKRGMRTRRSRLAPGPGNERAAMIKKRFSELTSPLTQHEAARSLMGMLPINTDSSLAVLAGRTIPGPWIKG